MYQYQSQIYLARASFVIKKKRNWRLRKWGLLGPHSSGIGIMHRVEACLSPQVLVNLSNLVALDQTVRT